MSSPTSSPAFTPVAVPKAFPDNKLFSLPVLNHTNLTKTDVLTYFNNTWAITECLFSALLTPSTYRLVPDKLRHPLIFYYCHPASFYINKFILAGILPESARINKHFEEIFAVGVDEMSWDDYERDPMDWPSAESVTEYRKKAYDVIADVINTLEVPAPLTWNDKYWAIPMGMDHERIHIETSSVLFRQLPVDCLRKPLNWPDYPPIDNEKSISNKFLPLPSTVVKMGKPIDFPTYGWDNEYGTRTVTVPAFEAAQRLTTNLEFLRFVESGGYDDNRYWSEEGWAWRCFIKPKYPLFWVKKTDGWKLRTIFDEILMPWNWPVVVNYLEADAFAKWSGEGIRLITEAEWNVLQGELPEEVKGTIKQEPLAEISTFPGNTMLRFGSESSVDQFPPNKAGFYDVYGNVWQWTEDHNDGFSGFKIHPIYFDFSTPCFDARHNIIQGGSFISTGCQATLFGRFAFRRHFFQHAGIRLARTTQPISRDLYDIGDNPHLITVNHWVPSSPYESDSIANQYLTYAYADNELIFNGFHSLSVIPELSKCFPARCADICKQHVLNHLPSTQQLLALDIGCGVGRSTFELASFCTEVKGIDLSQKFINICNKLKKVGEVPFTYALEGKITRKSSALVDPQINRDRCTFVRGDACNLQEPSNSYHIILAANILDRIPYPAKFLQSLYSILKPDGLLVLTTPYTWLEDYTWPTNWLGGYIKEGKELSGFDGLSKILSFNNHFSLLSTSDVPFVLRQHSRLFELCVSNCTVWKKTRLFQKE